MPPKKGKGSAPPKSWVPPAGYTPRQTRGQTRNQQQQPNLWQGLTDRGEAYDAQGNHVLVRPVRQRRGGQQTAAPPAAPTGPPPPPPPPGPPAPPPPPPPPPPPIAPVLPPVPSPHDADSGDESDDGAGGEPGTKPDDGSGGESGDEPNNESGEEPEVESGDESEEESQAGSGDESGDEPEAGSGDESVEEPESESDNESGDDTAGPSSDPTPPKRPTRTPLPNGRPTKIKISLKATKPQTSPVTESQDSNGSDSAVGPSADESDSDPEAPEESSEPEEPEDDASRDDNEEQTDNSQRSEGSDPEGPQDSDQGTPDEATRSRRSTPGSVGGDSEQMSTPSKTPQERKGSKNEDPIQVGSEESESSEVPLEPRSEDSQQDDEPHQPTIVHYGSDDETEMLVHERPDPDQTFNNGDDTLNLEDYPSSVGGDPGWRGEYDGSEDDGDDRYDTQSGSVGGAYEDNEDDDDDSEVHLPDYTIFEPDETEGQPEMGRGQGSESDLSRQSSPGGVSPVFPRNDRSPSHSPGPSAGGQQQPSGSSGGQGSTAQGRKNGQSSGNNKGSATGGGHGSAATKTKNATGKRGRPEDHTADDEARPQKRQREDMGTAAVPTVRKKFPRAQYRQICPYPSPRESRPKTSDKRATVKRPSSLLDETVEKPAKKTRLL
ncbi:hypothetical protein CTAM01_09046 [Colletotrichum tamarilloi]|uniref:Uncharacterized protein n=1 Tax=Colletotrichum tamarilloi TaxID=1209934 RepID=A0ABQ9R4D0_9PEZI|nr:uncharacterized protein CTAM01_09046 [Colletotrichum tamarilloi]KAK1494165.1 hypothetical protein CTAM01_09046 [Colletotrichum tamarilloi]